MVSFAVCLAIFGGLKADDELTITELYGQAVHAYFDGSYEEAHKHLTDAIELGTEDPRVFYFRGLAKMKLGRADEAAKDFEQGGKWEAQGAAQFYPIGRSLERIQGAERLAIEKVRKEARIAIRLRQKKIEAARIEAFKRNEKLRKAGPPVELGQPSDSSKSAEDPFGTTGKPSGTPAVGGKKPLDSKPAENKKPDDDPFGDPGDDPFAEPKKTEPAKEADASAESKTTSLDPGLQSQLALKVDLATAAKSFEGLDALKQQAGVNVPDTAKSLEILVNLPRQFTPDPSGINFHAKLGFSDEADAKQVMNMILQAAPTIDQTIGGKSYKVVATPGAPTVCFSMDGASIVISSKGYVESGADSFASANLQTIMKGLDKDIVQMGFDMKGAKAFLQGAMLMVPQDDPMTKSIVDAVMQIDAIKMTSGVGENLMMLGFDAADADGAKAIRQQLQKGLALVAAGAAMMSPDEKKAPASAEFFSHVMTCLLPKKEGNTTKIVITKPDNYDEMLKKMQKEVEDGSALPPGLLGP
ncbi:MAG: tetratricopeptide repeat protein, partial [Planctomycetota bacterium]|nr:tetratricopeptide repeat protein [Planctomycetota bacterium]